MRRRDNLTAAMHMLVEALFWFHPMVWWLGVASGRHPRAGVRRARRCRNGRTGRLRRGHCDRLPALCGDAAHGRGRRRGRGHQGPHRGDSREPDWPAPDAVEARAAGDRCDGDAGSPDRHGRYRRGGIRRRAVTGRHSWRATGRSGAALRGGVHQAVRRVWRRGAAERDEGDALRLLWFAVVVAGRAGIPCTAGPGPPRRPAGVDRYRALRDRRNDSRRCPGERAAGANDQPAEGSLQDGGAH